MSTQQFAGAVLAAAALFVVEAGCGGSSEPVESGTVPTGTGENLALGTFKVEIQSVELPEDAAARPTMTFRVTSNGAPVDDLLQRVKNGAVTAPATPTAFPWTSRPRFVLSVLQPSNDYRSYYEVTPAPTGAPFRIPNFLDPASPTTVQPKITTPVTQATFAQVTPATPENQLTVLGDGVYKFTYPAIPAGVTVDRNATHTAGVWMSNHPSATAESEPVTATYNFVPSGARPHRFQTVTTEGCNRCHAPAVEAHDERLGTQVCLTCHSPQSTDPESGNTVDFKAMIHKIHYGSELPSATGASGTTYTIVGFQQNAFRFADPWINDVRRCSVCHQGENADNWRTAASVTACTACHDNVNLDPATVVGTECKVGTFETARCDHPSLGTGAGHVAAATDCRQCHTATAPVVGVERVHVPLAEQQKAFRYDLMSVTVNPDTRVPTLRFAVRKPDGSAYDLATDPAYTDPNASLTAAFAWPAQEFTNEGFPPPATGTRSPGQPFTVPIVARPSGAPATTPAQLQAAIRPVGGNEYEVDGPPFPAAADTPITSAALLGGAASAVASGQVHLEGHPVLHGEQLPVQNGSRSFTLGGDAAPQRRQVVDVAKCDACHGYVNAHGRNRNDVPQVCVECHNSRATDWGRRQSSAATTAAACRKGTVAGDQEQSIDFKILIHEIHSADIRHDPVTICGFGNVPHTFPGDIPHGVSNCNLCHVNDSFRFPANDQLVPLDTTVSTNGTSANQADDTRVPRAIAVCTSCHDQTRFAASDSALPVCTSLAQPNSALCRHTGGLGLDVSTCILCHGAGAAFDVASVHEVQR